MILGCERQGHEPRPGFGGPLDFRHKHDSWVASGWFAVHRHFGRIRTLPKRRIEHRGVVHRLSGLPEADQGGVFGPRLRHPEKRPVEAENDNRRESTDTGYGPSPSLRESLPLDLSVPSGIGNGLAERHGGSRAASSLVATNTGKTARNASPTGLAMAATPVGPDRLGGGRTESRSEFGRATPAPEATVEPSRVGRRVMSAAFFRGVRETLPKFHALNMSAGGLAPAGPEIEMDKTNPCRKGRNP